MPYKKLVQDDYFINSSAVIRRSALKYSGLQNETLHKGPDGEDHDLWLRIGTLGEMWLMPIPLVVYRDFLPNMQPLQRRPWRGGWNPTGQDLKFISLP
ncbi:MAG: hypothetical protein MZV70_38790 [Desulfobacterales bacterium]|nr:hypothetical protein [Desulfobacterales bacterium]